MATGPDEPTGARDDLFESEGQFRALIENAFDAFVVLDRDGMVRYISPSVEPRAGYSRVEVLGNLAFDYVHPDDRPPTLQAFQELLSDPGRSILGEVRFRHKDGTYHVAEVVGTNLFHHPQIRGAVVNFRDVCERKKSQRALRESEEKYRLIFENAFDVIGTFDTQLRVLSVSPSVQGVLGYRPEELVGKTLLELHEEIHAMLPEHLEEALENLRRVLTGEAVGIIPYGFQAKDGTPKFAEVSAAPIVQDGQVTAAICIGRDITERVNYEHKLKQISQKVLVAQEEERARLARDLHDDLGQLLTVIQMDLSRTKHRLASDADSRAQIDAIIGHIEGAAQSLRRVCVGLRPPLLDDLGFTSALRDYLRDLQARSGLQVRFSSDLEDGALDPLARVALFRIAQEALTNVLRHAGTGAAVEVELERAGPSIRMRIRDDGQGFDREAVEAKVTAGLHGMRERAELCGGRLAIDTAPGAGTTVSVVLPAGDRHQHGVR